MHGLTDEGRRIVEDVAQRHGVGTDAVFTLLMALVAGHGTQAQFSHPDLGGMGQWSQGGMIMVGDMFNNALKFRVDALCNELSGLLRSTDLFAPAPSSFQSQSQSGGGVSLFVAGSSNGGRWPSELGSPSSAGSQNDLHYAVFPAVRRLAIEQGGRITVYDTRDHHITGFSQQQGGDQSLTFTSQYGLVRVADLAQVDGSARADATPPAPSPEFPATPFVPEQAPVSAPAATPSPISSSTSDDDVFAKLERLAELHRKDVITAQEFEAKKAELLARI